MPEIKPPNEHIIAFLDAVFLAGQPVYDAAVDYGLRVKFAAAVAHKKCNIIRGYPYGHVPPQPGKRAARPPYCEVEARAKYETGWWTAAALGRYYNKPRRTMLAAIRRWKVLNSLPPSKERVIGVHEKTVREAIWSLHITEPVVRMADIQEMAYHVYHHRPGGIDRRKAAVKSTVQRLETLGLCEITKEGEVKPHPSL